MFSSSRCGIIALVALLIIFIVVTALLLFLHSLGLFYGMVGLPQGELICSRDSPDGLWKVSVYLVGGNSTVDYSIRAQVTNSITNKSRNIYWKYHESRAEIEWINNNTVRINEMAIDVRTETYDWRLH